MLTPPPMLLSLCMAHVAPNSSRMAGRGSAGPNAVNVYAEHSGFAMQSSSHPVTFATTAEAPSSGPLITPRYFGHSLDDIATAMTVLNLHGSIASTRQASSKTSKRAS